MARVVFSKTGRVRYTSHLDVMRMFTRAFKRSGLPLWHTRGFNPHLYMMFPLPLALGYESLCEPLDIRLTQDIPLTDVVSRLNGVLPTGFTAISADTPVMSPGEIAFAEYDIAIQCDISRLEEFLALPKIEVLKKTKKGEKLLDIKPLVQALEINAADFRLRTAAGQSQNINPSLLLNEFYRFAGIEPETVKITRIGILTADNRDFV